MAEIVGIEGREAADVGLVILPAQKLHDLPTAFQVVAFEIDQGPAVAQQEACALQRLQLEGFHVELQQIDPIQLQRVERFQGHLDAALGAGMLRLHHGKRAEIAACAPVKQCDADRAILRGNTGTNGTHLFEAIGLRVALQQHPDLGLRLQCNDPPLRANVTGEGERVGTDVGARINDRAALRDQGQEKIDFPPCRLAVAGERIADGPVEAEEGNRPVAPVRGEHVGFQLAQVECVICVVCVGHLNGPSRPARARRAPLGCLSAPNGVHRPITQARIRNGGCNVSHRARCAASPEWPPADRPGSAPLRSCLPCETFLRSSARSSSPTNSPMTPVSSGKMFEFQQQHIRKIVAEQTEAARVIEWLAVDVDVEDRSEEALEPLQGTRQYLRLIGQGQLRPHARIDQGQHPVAEIGLRKVPTGAPHQVDHPVAECLDPVAQRRLGRERASGLGPGVDTAR